MSETEDTKITINFDSDKILEKIKKEKKDETVIKQDKLLFKLMMHNYDDEIRRNELIDSKNSQMIAFLGIMLTIQLTLFVNVLSTYLSKDAWPLSLKVSSCVLLIFALLFYVVSIGKFVDAYAFCGEFKNAPKPDLLLQKSKDNVSERKLLKGFLTNFPTILAHNNELMEDKIRKANDGFIFLKVGGIVSVLFVIYIL